MLVKDARYLAKRLDPISMPNGSGISGAVFASSTAVTTTGLALDNGVPAGPSPTAPLFTVVATSPPSASSTQLTGAGSNSIPVATVIGSCIGAFVFVSALIFFGFWFYRRYTESLKKQALSRSLQNDKHRQRPWNKLEDDEDKWEGTNQTKEVDQVVPMEKLTMFKRAASVRTAYTQKSVEDHTLTYPQSFAPFDANLVRTLSADHTIDSKSQPSQVANSVKGPSNLSTSNSLGEPLSSSPNMAIPTPEATVLQSHKWESAEVVQYEGPSAEVVESSAQDKEARRSMHNPFFGSQEYIQSRSDSHTDEKSPKAKGKERMHDSMTSSLLSSDPFEALVAQLPKPVLTNHQATDSSASAESKTRALQTLMGALELSEDEIRERLRVASMQPSEFLSPVREGYVKN